MLNVLTLHLDTGTPFPHPAIDRFAALAGRALDELARAAGHGAPPPRRLEPLLAALESDLFPRERHG